MQKLKKNILNINKKNTEIALLIFLIFILAIIVGVNRINTSNFIPINGDFQNYNPVRRFLNGEIPFKDFAVYLGCGHLILLSIIQIIVGNNFTASLFVTNMMTMLIFELTVFTISFFILKNKKQALYMAVIFGIINILRPYVLESNLSPEFISALDFGIQPGVSARMIRVAIIPIIAILTYLGNIYLENSKKEYIINYKDLIKKIYLAVIAGGAILWSNDGGIATYISISFVYFLWLVKKYKKDIKSIIKYTFMYIGVSILSFIILAMFITRGNIGAWFEFNLGVSSYQRWYYGSNINEKSNISLLDIDLSILNVVMIGIAFYYIYKLFKAKEKNDIINYGLLTFLVITSILSAYLYQLLSGGISKNMLVLVLLVIVCTYIVKLVINMLKEKRYLKYLKTVTIIVAIGVILNNSWLHFYNIKHRDPNAIYIEELGGYFTEYGDSIKLAMEKIGNQKIFSTYASAVEVATGQFQPNGIDYIIHCLGDKQREEYMNVFRQGDFKYVCTVDRDFNNYRYWTKNANWFFYRELYKDYKPTFVTEYNLFFEKKDIKSNIEVNAQIDTIKQDDHTYILQIQTDDESFNGMVDVKVSYNSNFKRNFFRTLDINRYVFVEDTTGHELANGGNSDFFIPNESDGYFIPITILDGKGEVKITTYPERNTELEINSAEILDFFDVMFKYCAASKDKNIDNNIIFVDNTSENKVILDGVKSIKINETERKILSCTNEDNFIKLELDGSGEDFKYPNCFEVIK